MVFFRRKKSATTLNEPVPDWNDTRWRSHLRANALGTEHHCGIYVQIINDDRKEAARLFKKDDTAQARNYAESSLRHNRTVTALAALSPLSNALYQRAEPLAGYTSLVQIPEPARSGIVTIIFAAGRLHMNYLSETVQFLREQFGPVHINAIQKGEGELYALVNPTVRDALSPAPATREDIDAELASAVKQYFGISIPESAPRSSGRANTAADLNESGSSAMERPPSPTEMRRSQTTPLSAMSSEMGAPVSPQLSEAKKPRRLTEETRRAPPGRSRMYASATTTGRYHASSMAGYAQPQGYQEPVHEYQEQALEVRDEVLPHKEAGGSMGGGSMGGGSMGRLSAGVESVGEGSIGGGSVGGASAGAGSADSSLIRKAAANLAAAGLGAGGLGTMKELGRHRAAEGGVVGGDVVAAEREVHREMRIPEHLRTFADSDEMLLRRYDHLCAVLTTLA
eukprot:GFKZ01015126.1.p1 GENE.GFKZ01015126.1~~GFKZ01015126.1.p1  ORF type:complete len:454 (+),score=62.74 GFKZ01015126.1:107-1468(+)